MAITTDPLAPARASCFPPDILSQLDEAMKETNIIDM